MHIGILHYAYVPVIGGVELIMEQHAALFARHGHEVTIITGRGEDTTKGVRVIEVPELLVGHPECAASQEGLASEHGHDSPAFLELKEKLHRAFRAATAGCDIVFVHNVLTMHFNLAATAAIWELADEDGAPRLVSWIHDLAIENEDYGIGDEVRYPWDLIRRSHPDIGPVVISPKRQSQFCDHTGLDPWDVPVIPNGVEFMRLLKLPQDVRYLARKLGALYRDIVLIQPCRVLRRKNIECGIRTTAKLKELGHSCLYLITGAPDPHNSDARHYGDELKALISELDLEDDCIFVGERFRVSDRDLVGLYSISDALFLPSRQEGFGLPLLEAGFFRLPVFCPSIEPMKSILEHNVQLFDLDEPPERTASLVADTLAADPGHLARKETIRHYSWERLLKKEIAPRFLS